jgi:hypothetical protein
LATAVAPTTLAVLEPVNFAPYVRTAITIPSQTGSQPGKGVTAAAAQVDLTIGTKNNYDYNDADPCYTGTGGTTRSACNDNVQVTTFLFGGGNLLDLPQQLHTYFFNDLQSAPASTPQFNLPAGAPQLYVVLTDALGAQGYLPMQAGGNYQVCDPGNASTYYTPTIPSCPLSPALPTGVSIPPAQTILPLPNLPNGRPVNSVDVAFVTSSVGFGGSQGLIPLIEGAAANVTAGQTSGFVWNALTENPLVQQGSPLPVFTLACVSADGTNLNSVGITCTVPPTYTYSTSAGLSQPPSVYIVTTSNTAVGALHDAPLSHDMRIVAAIVFPVGAIPLVLLLRRRKALKLSGWLAVLLFASLVGVSIGCGSNGFKNEGGTTTTATPAGTYQFMITATSGSTTINSPKFSVTVSPVH